jgi:hypothetical protein
VDDITGAKLVEIEIREDGKVVWVHVNGQTELRICQVDSVAITDKRGHNKPIDSSGWRYLLTIPVGWRPAWDEYHASVDENSHVTDQFKVTTDGGVWLHPNADKQAVRWSLHQIYDAPREALGLPPEIKS